MSWDVTLRVPGVPWASCDWNYTSNTNPMIMTAMDDAGIERTFVPGSRAEQWRLERASRGNSCGRRPAGSESADIVWTPCALDCCPLGFTDVLDGRTGSDGLRILAAVVARWDEDPDRFRAMNPPNGWGDFDRLREVFADMIVSASTETPLVWEASS